MQPHTHTDHVHIKLDMPLILNYKNMNKSQHIKEVESIKSGSQLTPEIAINNLICIGSNENPYGPSKAARDAMLKAALTTNRYQWTETSNLVKAIAQEHQVTEKNVLLGAGSSELLALTAHFAHSRKKGDLIVPDPTFRIWQGAAEHMGIRILRIPLTDQKDTDLVAMHAAIGTDTCMVYLCSPNNPTGIAIPDQHIRSFVESVPRDVVILLDEAYIEYNDKNFSIDMIKKYPNLVIARTFSKLYGLAATRVGYVLGHEKIIENLGKVQSWQNASVSAVSIAAAIAVIQDYDFVKYCRTENTKCRNIFQKGLADLGLPYTPSVTSFSYFDTASYPRSFVDTLEQHKIIGARSFEENSTWMRLSIGTAEEMTQVVRVLKAGI